MQLTDDVALSMDVKQLLSQDVVYGIYDIQDDLERERIKALLISRAKMLRIESEYKALIKAFDNADKKLAEEYSKNSCLKYDFPLKCDKNGKPAETIENFLAVLRSDPMFDGLRFNALTYSPENVCCGVTERWTDADDSRAREYIESKYKMYSEKKLDDALRILFREREYHPIKQLIDTTKWDGIERIETLLIKWLKCEDTPYSREVSRLIFSGGINRLYNPGCKFDDVPVLIGTKQGEGKSTFVRWLALRDEFFTEVCEVEGQKGIEALEGAWICEIAELLALTKVKDIEAVKSYITKQSDKYRKPFDRRVTEHKRQCIFIGTTNKEQFLTDKSGNRRFYPIKVHQSGYELFDNKDQIQSDILQCWAEAKAKMLTGEMRPYANKEMLGEIRQKQQDAVEDDYREGMIISYLDDKTETCILDLWKNALNNEFSKPTKKDSNEIAMILQSLDGWERARTTKRFAAFGMQKYWINTRTENEALPFS